MIGTVLKVIFQQHFTVKEEANPESYLVKFIWLSENVNSFQLPTTFMVLSTTYLN